jgi:hypothetical protein
MDKPITVATLMAEIVEMSGVDFSSVPIGKTYGWFNKLLFRLGAPSPLSDRMGVVAMFQNETEVRVYLYPIANPKDAREQEELACTRYTLSKAAATFFSEVLALEIFKAEIAEELSLLSQETARPEDFTEGEEEEEAPEAPASEPAPESAAAPEATAASSP